MATMGLSRTVCEINGDFSQSNIWTPPLVFNAPPPYEGVPLGIDNVGWLRETSDGATRPERKYDDMLSRLDAIHERDRRSDRRQRGRQQRSRLRRASRGKKRQRTRKAWSRSRSARIQPLRKHVKRYTLDLHECLHILCVWDTKEGTKSVAEGVN